MLSTAKAKRDGTIRNAQGGPFIHLILMTLNCNSGLLLARTMHSFACRFVFYAVSSRGRAKIPVLVSPRVERTSSSVGVRLDSSPDSSSLSVSLFYCSLCLSRRLLGTFRRVTFGFRFVRFYLLTVHVFASWGPRPLHGRDGPLGSCVYASLFLHLSLIYSCLALRPTDTHATKKKTKKNDPNEHEQVHAVHAGSRVYNLLQDS